MSLEIRLENTSVGVLKVSTFQNSFVFDYPCSTIDICTNYIVKLPRNRYIFEAWGAEGGYNGGRGGYTKGILTIHETTEAKIFIGSKGNEIILERGLTGTAFNGGSQGASLSSNRSTGIGGGATDLRIGHSNLSLQPSHITEYIIEASVLMYVLVLQNK